MNEDFNRKRLNDLENNIRKDLDMLKKYEEKERVEGDPRRLERYRREIERQRESLTRYQQEYKKLQEQVTGEPPAEMQDTADLLRQMDARLGNVLGDLDDDRLHKETGKIFPISTKSPDENVGQGRGNLIDVIILVGGYAKRLWPLTQDKPKSLLKIMGKEILSYMLDNLNNFGNVNHIYISTNEAFEEHFIDFFNKHSYNMNIELIIESHTKYSEKLGPNGGLDYVRKVRGSGDYMIIAGDNMFEYSLSDFFNFFMRRNKSTIALQLPSFLKGMSQFGIVEVDRNDAIIEFDEKPSWPENKFISTGCYILKQKDFDLMPEYITGYLFSWDNVPGNDSERFLLFLLGDPDIDWAENAEIRKSDDGKIIRIFKDENSAEIMIDEEKKKATLKIGDGKIIDLKVKKENGKLNIYNAGRDIDSLGEFMRWLGKDKKTGIIGYKFIDEWFDVGTLDTLLLANRHYLRSNNLGKKIGAVEIKDNVYIDKGSIIKDSKIGPNVYIGKNCVITDSKISDALIYDNVTINEGEIQQSVIDEDSRVRGKMSGIIAK